MSKEDGRLVMLGRRPSSAPLGASALELAVPSERQAPSSRKCRVKASERAYSALHVLHFC